MDSTNVEALCDDMIILREQHEKLYCNSGMISVGNFEGIHVTLGFLKQIPGEMKKQFRDAGTDYPWEFSKEYHGVRFFAIEKEDYKPDEV